ncbi:MAG: MATE family efflux transporter [Lachnospiraceae bacterium]|nr:MATE family efflux transporter [Lachnospiraceae bacterium]
MNKKGKSFEMDMCNGPLLGKILLFAIPLMLSGILQLLFNAADIIVVGRFAGHEALAAVGSTGSLINLLINVFIGLSVGTNVLVAKYYGAQKEEQVSQTVHTSVLTSLICGSFLILVGLFLAGPLLTLMGTPGDVLAQATLYMRIYFLGMPVMMLYNFGAAILRAIGDTRRPLYYLLLAGVVNVVLNLIFVTQFHMGVSGVAIATVISQAISAALIVRALIRSEGCFHLDFKQLKIHPIRLKQMIRIGLPAGMQGAVFSISNVLIQSSINSFGSIVMAGSTAASNIEGFVYTSMNTFYQTALSFTSQNYGAKKLNRIPRILLLCLGCVTVVGLLLGNLAYIFGNQLLGIYSSDPEVISYGLVRMSYVCVPYFLCGIMDVMVGSLRGMGYSVMPMLVSLTGACGLRILWIFTVFQLSPTLPTLFISYPVTWTVTACAHIICFCFALRKKKAEAAAS